MQRLTDLREILRYVPHFRDKVFVIALDGAIVADDNFANLLLDIAVLPGVHVAFNQRLFGASAEARSRQCWRICLLKCGTRALQEALSGGDRQVEHAGDFGSGPAKNVPKQEYCPLPSGQAL